MTQTAPNSGVGGALTETRMANNHRYMGIGLSALFGVAALLFFGIGYPHHLHFQEQCQLFLFTRGYFINTVSIPGGLADYVGRFFTQFYYYAWAGAAIVAVLLVVVQRLVWALAKKVRLRWAFYPLTFVPAIALWAGYCDFCGMLSLFIACALCLLATRLYLCLSNTGYRLAFAAIMMPVLYWTIGSAYVTFVGLVVLFEGLRAAEDRAWGRWGIIVAVGAALTFLYPWSARSCVHFPLNRLLLGINYYRTTLGGLPLQFAVIVSAVFVPLVFRLLPKLESKKISSAVFLLGSVLVAAGGYYVVWLTSDMAREEEFAYDYHVRMANWEKILEVADNKPSSAPFAVACVNLALAKTGRMGDQMFNYCQVGPKGLFTQRDVYYHLGMINASQQIAFDAMETVGDLQKSARQIKRLAETNLINGQYRAAGRYLRLLQHTLFYRAWADETMALLGDEDQIDSHREYGALRRVRERTDHLWTFNPRFEDMQGMLERLVRSNGQNRMAYEYLLASALLEKKLERFLQCYPLGKDVRSDRIPTCYQEALSSVWWRQHSSLEGLPWRVDWAVQQRLPRFLDAAQRCVAGYLAKMGKETSDSRHSLDDAQHYAAAQLRGSFGKTYWYYLVFYSEEQER